MTRSVEFRWIPSSRKTPCPPCNRTKDDKCRHNAAFLMCWKGSSHHPPDLNVGEVVTLEGQNWAIVKTAGGYGGNSIALTSHMDRSSFQRSHALSHKLAAAVEPELRRQLARVRKQYKAALCGPSLHQMSPNELRRYEAVTSTCMVSLRNLLRALHRCRRDVPAADVLVPVVPFLIRQVSYEVADLQRFQEHSLGTPTNRQIKTLARLQEVKI